ncbi:GCN5-related N-acetyltransferase [Azorhizobium caulinodans ORS 571]|uniref:GCN5-related N-acetyltransferase n=1 Tax=Azorhizobium caulinodans (strain ATCC 43989 / DSM 5975 / JCM 20966 / LMG 6465 / NBRC 14845 / NCIMB 13405 / ORS 571) TaxID=438753 RepID=A8HUK7_AZOC5|nr:GNAT family N-acetyltransferase [Azorhizobium caulinodans]BAF86956.1 GCN5-related N-acetyltransferase [Azorhizobium caulinodans ORS 571]
MLLRPATLADVPAIADIYDDAVRTGTASFELDPPGVGEMTRRFDALMAGDYPYLVAVDTDETLLGYAYAGAFRPRIAYRFTVENSIYVAPGAQRRGVGKALLTALVRECEARGFRQMVAVIGDSANAGSIGVHRACGFRDVGIIKSSGLKFGRWLDTVLMQRDLGPGESTIPEA